MRWEAYLFENNFKKVQTEPIIGLFKANFPSHSSQLSFLSFEMLHHFLGNNTLSIPCLPERNLHWVGATMSGSNSVNQNLCDNFIEGIEEADGSKAIEVLRKVCFRNESDESLMKRGWDSARGKNALDEVHDGHPKLFLKVFEKDGLYPSGAGDLVDPIENIVHSTSCSAIVVSQMWL